MFFEGKINVLLTMERPLELQWDPLRTTRTLYSEEIYHPFTISPHVGLNFRISGGFIFWEGLLFMGVTTGHLGEDGGVDWGGVCGEGYIKGGRGTGQHLN